MISEISSATLRLNIHGDLQVAGEMNLVIMCHIGPSTQTLHHLHFLRHVLAFLPSVMCSKPQLYFYVFIIHSFSFVFLHDIFSGPYCCSYSTVSVQSFPPLIPVVLCRCLLQNWLLIVTELLQQNLILTLESSANIYWELATCHYVKYFM